MKPTKTKDAELTDAELKDSGIKRTGSVWLGILTILGLVVALVVGFRAMFSSGEQLQQQVVTQKTIQSSATGSCMFGNASRIICQVTTEEDCKDKKGLWSKQGTCETTR